MDIEQSILITIISTAVAIGTNWGIMKTKLDNMREEVQDLKNCHQRDVDRITTKQEARDKEFYEVKALLQVLTQEMRDGFANVNKSIDELKKKTDIAS